MRAALNAMHERHMPSPLPPAAGEQASGHGLDGVIANVPASQPLAAEDVWRVTLVGESCGRLVRPTADGAWHLLQLDELTEAQLDALEADSDSPTLC